MARTVEADQAQLFTSILKGVSRSFYLSLRVLPVPLRGPIGLAYLLARAADTLADTSGLPRDQRLNQLHRFKACLDDPENASDCDFGRAVPPGSLANPDEARLLSQLPQLFALLCEQGQPDRRLIRSVVTTLSDGMVFDLQRFPVERSGSLEALQYLEETDHYTYMVAGCVGEFWTEMSMAHSPALAHWPRQRRIREGIDFGKGLQWINILRDLPRDLRLGRCYLPLAWLARHGLEPTQLLDANNSDRARPLLHQGIDLALQHLHAAQAYVLAIPRRCPRLRLAALWPLMIGLLTLEQLALSERWLDAGVTVKVQRRQVYALLLKSLPLVCFDTALRRWIAASHGRINGRMRSAAYNSEH